MFKINICIPTYKRPEMLKKLILSIIGCNIDKSLILDIHIIIVDNDIDKSAELVIKELKEKLYTKYKISYSNYSIKGLSNVRNELIKRAIEEKPDFIVFVDDDEFVTPRWLNELVTTIIINNGDMARGPVIPKFDKKIKTHISYWFSRPFYSNNAKIKTIAAGNLIINLKSFLKYDIWFDSRFNDSGSEDSYFGEELIKKGATIYWASDAIAYEFIPEERSNLQWLLNRRFRVASTFVFRLKLGNNFLPLIKKIIVSLMYITLGCIMMIIIFVPIKIRYWGIVRFYEGIGGLSGLLNIIPKVYK